MFSCKFHRIFLKHNNMYTRQFIKSVKKIFLWYLYGRFREQIFKKSTILDKDIETFIKIRQIWKHTPPSVNRLTASYRKSLTVPENRLTNPSPAASKPLVVTSSSYYTAHCTMWLGLVNCWLSLFMHGYVLGFGLFGLRGVCLCLFEQEVPKSKGRPLSSNVYLKNTIAQG